MGLATYTSGEEEFGEVTDVLGAEAGAGTVRTLQRLSISSLNGSVVVGFISVKLIGLAFCQDQRQILQSKQCLLSRRMNGTIQVSKWHINSS